MKHTSSKEMEPTYRHYFELPDDMYGAILSIRTPSIEPPKIELRASNRRVLTKLRTTATPNSTDTINFQIYGFYSGDDDYILSGGCINSYFGDITAYGIRQKKNEKSLDLILVGLFNEEYKKITLNRILDALISFLKTEEIPSKLEKHISTIVKIYEDINHSLFIKDEFMQDELQI